MEPDLQTGSGSSQNVPAPQTLLTSTVTGSRYNGETVCTTSCFLVLRGRKTYLTFTYLNISDEYTIVVIICSAESQKIFTGLGTNFTEQLQLQVTHGCVQRYGHSSEIRYKHRVSTKAMYIC